MINYYVVFLFADPPEELDQFGALDELGHCVELLEEIYNEIWKKEMDTELSDAIQEIWDNIQDAYGSGELSVGLHEHQTELYHLLDNGYELPHLQDEEQMKLFVEKTSQFILKVVAESWM